MTAEVAGENLRGGWRHWPVRRRIGVALSGVGVILLALVVTSGIVLVQMRDAQDMVVDDLFTTLTRSNSVLVSMVDAETAVRGFALNAREDTLQPFEAAESSGAPWEERTYQPILDGIADPDIRTSLEQVQADAQRWFDEWAEPTITTVRLRGVGSVSSADVERGKELFDAFRAKYSTYRGQVVALRAEQVNALNQRTIAQFGLVTATTLFSLGAGLVLWMLMLRWVSRPVDQLGRETRVVTTVDLQHEVSVEGPPEFQRLGADVEAMRRRLVDQIAEVEAAGREIAAARRRLEDQAEDLVRSNRELEQFAYVASHDLQEPLRKVTSFCQMLERRYAGQLDERADQYIAFAVDGAKRMQLLINDLLQFSRVGRGTREREPVELEPVLAGAVTNLGSSIEEAGAVVTHDPLPEVWGEAGLLAQLFQNLIGNAVKFRKPDQTPHIHLSARRDGDMWEFACADDGIGIEPQYAERIFLIFQRLHPKDVYSGTGIGLALCQKIVEYHGGRIWVDTTVTEGTTFRWTLPPVPAVGPPAVASEKESPTWSPAPS